jgi:hypothetical protein
MTKMTTVVMSNDVVLQYCTVPGSLMELLLPLAAGMVSGTVDVVPVGEYGRRTTDARPSFVNLVY